MKVAPKKKTRTRRTPPTPNGQEAVRCVADIKPTKFYLGRDGVAFGPYSEWQLRESVRLGLFEGNDLALAEDGQEWRELSRLLPASVASQEPPSDKPSAPPLLTANQSEEWQEVAELLPPLVLPRDKPLDKRSGHPVSEHLLREHEIHFATFSTGSFMVELTRGRFAFAAVPVAVVFLSLLILAAVLKHHEPTTNVQSHPRYAQKLSATPTRVAPVPLTPTPLSASRSVAGAPWSPGSLEVGTIPVDAVASTSR